MPFVWLNDFIDSAVTICLTADIDCHLANLHQRGTHHPAEGTGESAGMKR